MGRGYRWICSGIASARSMGANRQGSRNSAHSWLEPKHRKEPSSSGRVGRTQGCSATAPLRTGVSGVGRPSTSPQRLATLSGRKLTSPSRRPWRSTLALFATTSVPLVIAQTTPEKASRPRCSVGSDMLTSGRAGQAIGGWTPNSSGGVPLNSLSGFPQSNMPAEWTSGLAMRGGSAPTGSRVGSATL